MADPTPALVLRLIVEIRTFKGIGPSPEYIQRYVVAMIFRLWLCPIGDQAPAALLTLRSPSGSSLLTLAHLGALSAP
jgi:hypothetical protein